MYIQSIKQTQSHNLLAISERKTQKNLKQMVKIIEQNKEIKKKVMKANAENEKIVAIIN